LTELEAKRSIGGMSAQAFLSLLLLAPVFSASVSAEAAPQKPENQKQVRHTVFKLDFPKRESADESAGGIIVADVNGDGKMDFLLTTPGLLLVVGNDGKELWRKTVDIRVGGQSESQGLPGHHAPGVAVGDIDGDGKAEVVFLTQNSVLHVVNGATGEDLAAAKPPVPKGAARWEVAMIANFRGAGEDRDVLLQATNEKGYRMGRYLAAYSFETLLDGGKPLWTTDAFVSCAHNSARLADLDGDGRDEVLGATIYSPDGKLLVQAAPFEGHMDSVFAADLRPELPGLEVVLLEEGSDQVQVLGLGGLVWRNHFKKQEPQNAVIGRFKPGSDELFIWCRSRYNQLQKPFVFNSAGEVVAHYELSEVAPKDWTKSGVEVIHRIDWTGDKQQLACAKARHTRGDVCIFEPLTGKFVERFTSQADRLYVADVRGDWREEVIVLSGNELHIYENLAPNPRPNEPRLWEDRNYRRMKQYHNYYSP
jgi:hypothetical protein